MKNDEKLTSFCFWMIFYSLLGAATLFIVLCLGYLLVSLLFGFGCSSGFPGSESPGSLLLTVVYRTLNQQYQQHHIKKSIIGNTIFSTEQTSLAVFSRPVFSNPVPIVLTTVELLKISLLKISAYFLNNMANVILVAVITIWVICQRISGHRILFCNLNREANCNYIYLYSNFRSMCVNVACINRTFRTTRKHDIMPSVGNMINIRQITEMRGFKYMLFSFNLKYQKQHCVKFL